MDTTTHLTALDAIRGLTLDDIERRIVELDGERASLVMLRRTLVARERGKRRSRQRTCTQGGQS